MLRKQFTFVRLRISVIEKINDRRLTGNLPVVNVLYGETFQKYDNDPFIKICMDKKRMLWTTYYHL